ncbi:MAG: carbon storage regulator CsrA [Sulfobacillus sp.]
MLVLSRKTNEALVIQEGAIRIVVLSVQGDQVKLGIDAPRNISVMREEIYLATHENQRAANSVSPDDLTSFTPPATEGPFPPEKPKSR